MTLDEFDRRLKTAVSPGMIFCNPGGGTSEIVSIRGGKISYRRKSSIMTISIKALYEAVSTFGNSKMSSPRLKAIWPSIFDSNARPAGHSCNVTFMFLCLKQMGLVTEIKGGGTRGNPYYVDFQLNGLPRGAQQSIPAERQPDSPSFRR